MQTRPYRHTVYSNWEEMVAFDDQGPAPRPLIESDRLKAVVVGLKPGQSVPHHTSTEAVYHFLHGTGSMTVDDETIAVQAGTTVVVPDGAFRGISAASDLVFLGTRPGEKGNNELEHTR